MSLSSIESLENDVSAHVWHNPFTGRGVSLFIASASMVEERSKQWALPPLSGGRRSHQGLGSSSKGSPGALVASYRTYARGLDPQVFFLSNHIYKYGKKPFFSNYPSFPL